MSESKDIRDETRDSNEEDLIRFNWLGLYDLVVGFRENIEQDEADQDPSEQPWQQFRAIVSNGIDPIRLSVDKSRHLQRYDLAGDINDYERIIDE